MISSFMPGTQILFKSGDIFNGGFTINRKRNGKNGGFAVNSLKLTSSIQEVNQSTERDHGMSIRCIKD